MPATNFPTSRFLLIVDGQEAGFVQSVEGGAVSAEVIAVSSGSELFSSKHIGPPQYEDLGIQIGLSMSPAFYAWVADSWVTRQRQRDLSVIVCDAQLKAIQESQFFRTLITETTFPALDASSKDAGTIDIKFTPELSRTKKGSGQLVPTSAPTKQKQWLVSNFRLDIPGLDCAKVSRIDTFTVKQTLIRHTDGAGATRIAPDRLDFPNLKISLAESSAQSWLQWHEDFVVKGNNGAGQERKGSLTLLAPNLTSELVRINFFNLGIFRMGREKAAADKQAIARLTAELYCERMELVVIS
ncbi:MAG: phage tail protein [Burkholderiales bacterium]|nr:phage tail protein [Burkholderiales bacterium]